MKIKIIFSFLAVAFFSAGILFAYQGGLIKGSVLGDTVSVTTDMAPLHIPYDVAVTLTGPESVRVTWQHSYVGDSAVKYQVFRNGSAVKYVTSKQYDDNSVEKGKAYTYSVRAVTSEQMSPMSGPASISVPAPVDIPTGTDESETMDGTENTASTVEPGLKVADAIPPSSPSGVISRLAATGGVEVVWKASSDNVGIHGYRIYRNGAVLGTSKTRTFMDADVRPGARYAYAVVAVDTAGNVSQMSSKTDIFVPQTATAADGDTVLGGGGAAASADMTPPSAPSGLSVEVLGGHAVRVRWEVANDDVGVANYMVYRDGTNIGMTFSATYYDDITALPGKRHAYHVVARDIAKNESAPSATGYVDIPVDGAEKEPFLVPRVFTAGTEPAPEKIFRDADADGLSDAEENRLGTNPGVADTDGDGFVDGDEIRAGFDPLKYSKGDKSDKITFESPKDSAIRENADLVDVRYTVRKIERRVSEETGRVMTKLSGTGLPNSIITVYVYSDPIVIVAKTDANGNWTYELDRDLEDGDHEVYVAVTDNIGRITAKSEPIPFVKTAEAITVQAAGAAEQGMVANQSPIDRYFTQYVVAGFLLALLFVVIAIVVIYRRSSSGTDKPMEQ